MISEVHKGNYTIRIILNLSEIEQILRLLLFLFTTSKFTYKLKILNA